MVKITSTDYEDIECTEFYETYGENYESGKCEEGVKVYCDDGVSTAVLYNNEDCRNDPAYII